MTNLTDTYIEQAIDQAEAVRDCASSLRTGLRLMQSDNGYDGGLRHDMRLLLSAVYALKDTIKDIEAIQQETQG